MYMQAWLSTACAYHLFCTLQALSEHANLREEYVLWQQHRESSPGALVSLCQMPYLLNPIAKSRILRGEAVAQQQSNMANATMQASWGGG